MGESQRERARRDDTWREMRGWGQEATTQRDRAREPFERVAKPLYPQRYRGFGTVARRRGQSATSVSVMATLARPPVLGHGSTHWRELRHLVRHVPGARQLVREQ